MGTNGQITLYRSFATFRAKMQRFCYANMATDQNQERDLRVVVENLVSHPGFRRIVSDAVQGSNISNSSSHGSSTTDTSSSSNARSYSSPQQELRAIFRAGGGGQGRGRGGGTVASFVPVLGSQNRFSSRSARSQGGGNRRARPKKFTREVVLLSKAESRFVVRGSNKADLVRRGQVIQCFEFYKEWTEEEVFQHLRDAFNLVLNDTG